LKENATMRRSSVAESVRFRPRRLGHANLFVGDLERSMQFYNEVCGLEVVRREPGIKAGFLSNGNTHHDVGLIQAARVARVGRAGHVQVSAGRGHEPGLNHLGFEMENEARLVEAYGRARAAGVEIHRTTDHQVSLSVYLFDPEANLIEFYADVTQDWRRIFRPEKEDLVSGPWTPGERAPSSEPKYSVDPEIRRVADAVFHPRRIVHAVLLVRDFDAALEFYTEVAGLEEVAGDRDHPLAVLRGTASTNDLVLAGTRENEPTGLHHIAFEVTDERDLDAAEAALRGAGVEPEFRVDDRTKRSTFVRDPDGIQVELYFERSRSFGRPSVNDGDRRLYQV
jgi:catechol 2,3-dioxygenase